MVFAAPTVHHIDHHTKSNYRNRSKSPIGRNRSRSPISRNENKLDPAIRKDRAYYSKPKPTASPKRLRNQRSTSILVNGDKVVPEAENVHVQ
jgi:hypothetical protein